MASDHSLGKHLPALVYWRVQVSPSVPGPCPPPEGDAAPPAVLVCSCWSGACLLTAASFSPRMMWAAGAVAAMSSITFPAISAMVSRNADPDQQGKYLMICLMGKLIQQHFRSQVFYLASVVAGRAAVFVPAADSLFLLRGNDTAWCLAVAGALGGSS